MSTILDLFIQDFVTTNRLLGQHWTWDALSSRRLLEAGPATKVFEFTSGGIKQIAIGRWLALPDGDWFRIELTHPLGDLPADLTAHRFDCLRMMYPRTHSDFTVEGDTTGLETPPVFFVKLTTRHRGLLNLVFVVRDGAPAITNPFLI